MTIPLYAMNVQHNTEIKMRLGSRVFVLQEYSVNAMMGNVSIKKFLKKSKAYF